MKYCRKIGWNYKIQESTWKWGTWWVFVCFNRYLQEILEWICKKDNWMFPDCKELLKRRFRNKSISHLTMIGRHSFISFKTERKKKKFNLQNFFSSFHLSSLCWVYHQLEHFFILWLVIKFWPLLSSMNVSEFFWSTEKVLNNTMIFSFNDFAIAKLNPHINTWWSAVRFDWNSIYGWKMFRP